MTLAGRLAGLAVAAALACAPERPPAQASPVAARVDGRPVSAEELRTAARGLGVRAGPVDWNAALESFVAAGIVSDELARRGLHERDDYRERLAAIRGRAWRSEQDLAREALAADIEASLALSEADLRAHYEAQRDRFLTTRLHLRQITVADRETIRAIHARVQQGEDFARLASEANLDPALRRSAGDLGFVEQRKLPTAMIGPAHRLLQPGEVSEAFRDREGRWSLMQLVAREQDVRRDFEDVREQLERELRVIRGREILTRLVEERRAGISASLEAAPP